MGEIEGLVTGLIGEWSENTERSLYAAERRIGVSDIGGCHEYARRLIDNVEFSDPRTNFMPAFMGTAFGELFERAYQSRHPDAVTQISVKVPIRIRGYEINLPGHPDIVHGNRIIDGKTKNGLAVVRKEGGSKQHKFQLTLYARACIEEGLVDEQCTLALVYYDRSGVEEEPFVVEWTYDPALLTEAEEWLSDVIYAVEQRQEASRDMPREWCFSYCPYATDCRGLDTDVEGTIEDPELLTAIEVYLDAHEREKQAKADKATAQKALKGAAGYTATHSLRWITIAETVIPETRRKASERIDLRPKR